MADIVPFERLVEQAQAAAELQRPPPGTGVGCTCPKEQPLARHSSYEADKDCPLHGFDAILGKREHS